MANVSIMMGEQTDHPMYYQALLLLALDQG